MRHKYETQALVLSRSHTGEATTLVTLLTPELGLVHARAQSLRSPGAKLAHALATLVESEVVLVRGKEGWRVAGAVLVENWFKKVPSSDARARAGRVATLLLRLVAGEERDSRIFLIYRAFLETLVTVSEENHEAAEVLAVLRSLAVLGLDTGDILGSPEDFSQEVLESVRSSRKEYIARINVGIDASGL